MPDTGLVLGQSASDIDGASGWTGVANVLVNDTNAASHFFEVGGNSNRLRVLDFPWVFAEEPVGIEVQIRARADINSEATLKTVRLWNDGVAVAGGGGSQVLTTEAQIYTWGGPTDMWDLGVGGLSNAEAHDENFGMQVTGGLVNLVSATVFIEAIWMKIYYNVSGSGTASITLPGLNLSGQGKVIGTAGISLPGFDMKAHHRID